MKNIYLKFYVAEKHRHNGALLAEVKKNGDTKVAIFDSI